MAYAILFIFAVTALLSILEQYMGKTKWIPYILIGITLILLAGLREVGIDPDSENYAGSYRNYMFADDSVTGGVEYSFTLLAAFFNFFTDDVHAIFLFYAFWGLSLKFFAITRYTKEDVFLSVMLYLAFYYELHEVTQIRTGILSGCYLLALLEIGDGRRWRALLYLAIGCIFHVSGIILLPLVFLSNKIASMKSRTFWASLIPFGYLLYFAGMGILMSMESSIPYIGDKLELYQKGAEVIAAQVNVNVFSPLQLFTIALYIYLFIFYDTIAEQNKYFPVLMKAFSIGIFCLPTFAALPTLAERLNNLFNIVTIILYANIYYTIKPSFYGKVLVFAIGIILLNYGLPYIDEFTFLWKSST